MTDESLLASGLPTLIIMSNLIKLSMFQEAERMSKSGSQLVNFMTSVCPVFNWLHRRLIPNSWSNIAARHINIQNVGCLYGARVHKLGPQAQNLWFACLNQPYIRAHWAGSLLIKMLRSAIICVAVSTVVQMG